MTKNVVFQSIKVYLQHEQWQSIYLYLALATRNGMNWDTPRYPLHRHNRMSVTYMSHISWLADWISFATHQLSRAELTILLISAGHDEVGCHYEFPPRCWLTEGCVSLCTQYTTRSNALKYIQLTPFKTQRSEHQHHHITWYTTEYIAWGLHNMVVTIVPTTTGPTSVSTSVPLSAFQELRAVSYHCVIWVTESIS